VWNRSREHERLGSLKAISVLCVFGPSLFWLHYAIFSMVLQTFPMLFTILVLPLSINSKFFIYDNFISLIRNLGMTLQVDSNIEWKFFG